MIKKTTRSLQHYNSTKEWHIAFRMQQQKRKGYGNQQQMDALLLQISQISASLKKISEE